MDPVVASCVQNLKSNANLYKRALEGLEGEALHKRCSHQSSPMIWIAGHLVLARAGLANLMGVERELPWAKLFGRYSKIEKPSTYPDISEIVSKWNEVNEDLKRRFPEISDSELSAACPREFPTEDKSLRGGIAFLVWHESYHIGQMGYLRKWLGHESLVG